MISYIEKNNLTYFSITTLIYLFIFRNQEIGSINFNLLAKLKIIPFLYLIFYSFFLNLRNNKFKKINFIDFSFIIFFFYLIYKSLFINYISFSSTYFVKYFFFIVFYLSVINIPLDRDKFNHSLSLILILTHISLILCLMFFYVQPMGIELKYLSYQSFLGDNVPFFTGFFQSKTQFLNLLLIFIGLNFYLISQPTNFKYGLYFSLFLFCLYGVLSISDGFIISLTIFIFIYFMILINLNIKFYIYIFLIFSSMFLVVVFINYNFFLNLIENNLRFYPATYLINQDIINYLFGSFNHNLGFFTFDYGHRGFHNSLVTAFYNYGYIGFILFSIMIICFLFQKDFKNNLCLYPLLLWLIFGLVHNNINSSLIFIIICLSSSLRINASK